MINLKKAVEEYPELLHDRQRLRGMLLDLNTELADRPKINLLMSIYDLGIVNEIKSAPDDTALVSRMVTKARNQLFLDEKMAEWAVKEWCAACGVEITATCEKSKKKRKGSKSSVGEYDPKTLEIKGTTLVSCKNKKITEIVVPDGVTRIGASAFEGCLELISIIIPSSVTDIGESAFECCRKLMRIKLSDNISVIRSNTFASCYSLRHIDIPDSVISIEEYAFCGAGLGHIIIPSSVKTIGRGAFYGCKYLRKFALEDFDASSGNEPFGDYDAILVRDNIKFCNVNSVSSDLPAYHICGWTDFGYTEDDNEVLNFYREIAYRFFEGGYSYDIEDFFSIDAEHLAIGKIKEKCILLPRYVTIPQGVNIEIKKENRADYNRIIHKPIEELIENLAKLKYSKELTFEFDSAIDSVILDWRLDFQKAPVFFDGHCFDNISGLKRIYIPIEKKGYYVKGEKPIEIYYYD